MASKTFWELSQSLAVSVPFYVCQSSKSPGNTLICNLTLLEWAPKVLDCRFHLLNDRPDATKSFNSSSENSSWRRLSVHFTIKPLPSSPSPQQSGCCRRPLLPHLYPVDQPHRDKSMRTIFTEVLLAWFPLSSPNSPQIWICWQGDTWRKLRTILWSCSGNSRNLL